MQLEGVQRLVQHEQWCAVAMSGIDVTWLGDGRMAAQFPYTMKSGTHINNVMPCIVQSPQAVRRKCPVPWPSVLHPESCGTAHAAWPV